MSCVHIQFSSWIAVLKKQHTKKKKMLSAHWNLQAHKECTDLVFQSSLPEEHLQTYMGPCKSQCEHKLFCSSLCFPLGMLFSSLTQQLYLHFLQLGPMTSCWMLSLNIIFSGVAEVQLKPICLQAFWLTKKHWHWWNLILKYSFKPTLCKITCTVLTTKSAVIIDT